MKIISHRGLLEGPNNRIENSLNQIDYALSKDFDVEIDLRYIENKWWLGHDIATYQVDLCFILERKKNLYIHAKDIITLYNLKILNEDYLNYFFHDNDNCTLTSLGHIWTYPDSKNILTNLSIAVLPERVNNWLNIKNCFGVCTDYPSNFT